MIVTKQTYTDGPVAETLVVEMTTEEANALRGALSWIPDAAIPHPEAREAFKALKEVLK